MGLGKGAGIIPRAGINSHRASFPRIDRVFRLNGSAAERVNLAKDETFLDLDRADNQRTYVRSIPQGYVRVIIVIRHKSQRNERTFDCLGSLGGRLCNCSVASNMICMTCLYSIDH